MIVNSELMYPPALVGELFKSKFEFYLTGSKFFEPYGDNLGYELFVQDDPEVNEYLENLGFIVEPANYYEDDSVVCAYLKKINCEIHALRKFCIYVFVHTVKSAEVKSLAQNNLVVFLQENYNGVKDFFSRSLEQQRLIWNNELEKAAEQLAKSK